PKPNVAIAKNTPVKRNDGMPIIMPNIPANNVPAIIPTMIDTSKSVVKSAVVYAPIAMKPALPNDNCPEASVIYILKANIILIRIKEATCKYYGLINSPNILVHLLNASNYAVFFPNNP